MKFSKVSSVLSLLAGSHAREVRRAKSIKEDVVVADAYADELCEGYCSRYFSSCANWNIYLNPEGKSSSVNGITTQESDLPRKDNQQRLADAKTECLKTCMTWPRPADPKDFASGRQQAAESEWDTEERYHFYFNSRQGGDTLWCRMNHLSLATDSNSGGFHCGHGTNPALAICRDVLVDGYTPYEWLRDGADTQHRLPYCDIAGEGKVADCTLGGVDSDNLHDVLASLPGNMEILFLNGNKITEINEPFAEHLKNPTNLKALYLNDNGLETVAADALDGLDNLEVWNADNNAVVSLDDNFLQYTENLKQFSMFGNIGLFGADGSIPEGFFQHTPKLEVMSLYTTGISHFLEGTFDGLTSLKMMSFVTNGGISVDSFPNPPELFKDLTSLQFFDFFGNPISSIPANFFGSWASNILRITFWNCPIETIDENAGLEHLTSIEQAYFHYQAGGPPFDGGSFEFGPVLEKLTAINSLVTFTYGTVTDTEPEDGGDEIPSFVPEE